MMKFAIRDDDTSFFTKPEDLENAYDFLNGGCVSLSVVPCTVPIHKDDVFPYGKGIERGFYDIADNQELINYLQKQLKLGRYEILLHGYSHEYSKRDGIWKAEMLWKSEKQLREELSKGKEHLERLLSCNVRVFVAPNNAINQNAISVIEDLAMDYSGIIQKNDRRVDIKYLVNFTKRWGYRAIKKIPYPGILDYGKHKELIAYTLDSYDRLVLEYQACKRRKQPFVIYTHYWQINDNPAMKDLLKRIYEYVTKDGSELIALSKCFEE